MNYERVDSALAFEAWINATTDPNREPERGLYLWGGSDYHAQIAVQCLTLGGIPRADIVWDDMADLGEIVSRAWESSPGGMVGLVNKRERAPIWIASSFGHGPWTDGKRVMYRAILHWRHPSTMMLISDRHPEDVFGHDDETRDILKYFHATEMQIVRVNPPVRAI